MVKLAAGLLVGAAAVSAHAQSIEGYWQDTERRILFSADAPPGFEYGRWTKLDPNQTYPSAKQFRRGANGVEVVDFLYDDEEVLSVRRADEKTIEFTRASTWSKCSVLHNCSLQGANEMLCSLERSCDQQVVWRGEERYARRASCERVEVRRAQGIPHRCR
jgi:hypothetical protein